MDWPVFEGKGQFEMGIRTKLRGKNEQKIEKFVWENSGTTLETSVFLKLSECAQGPIKREAVQKVTSSFSWSKLIEFLSLKRAIFSKFSRSSSLEKGGEDITENK